MRVTVRCHGRHCPWKRRSIVSSDGGVRFRRLQRRLPAGTIIEVFAARPGTIGKYTRFRIRRGRAPARVDSCFVAGAVADGFGPRPARPVLVGMLFAALGFYVATRRSGGDFGVFVVFQAAGLLAALAMYFRLAARRRPGAWLVAAALGVSLAAGAIQADESLALRLVWEFDHNGVYHLVQLGVSWAGNR